jgi:signal transduction histidine kinase
MIMKVSKKSLVKRVLLISILCQVVLAFLVSTYFVIDSENRTEEFVSNTVVQKTRAIFNSNEEFRLSANYSLLSRNVWNLNHVKGVNVFDSNCELLAATPINFRTSCSKNEGLVIDLRDQVSKVSKIVVDLESFKNHNLYKNVITIVAIVVLLLIITVSISYFVLINYFKSDLTDVIKEVMELGLKSDSVNRTDEIIKDVPVELRPLVQNISETTQELNEVQNELFELGKEKALFDLSLKVSHDLRAPLSVLKEFSKKQELDGIVTDSITRLGSIAEQLLEKNRSKSRVFLFDLKKSIENISKEKGYTNEGIKLSIDIKEPLALVSDKTALSSVISNLMNNSIEAGAQELIIKSRRVGDIIFVEISDNGPGFPDEILESDLSTSKSIGKKSGNGLALRNAKRDLEALGHKFEIYNLKGACVKITLNRGFDGKVLFLDDELIFRMLWEEYFKSVELDYYIASSPKELNSNIEQNRVTKNSLFVLDNNLGENESLGTELAKELFDDGYQNIIMATGNEGQLEESDYILGIVGKEPKK